jgi:MraZ protein
MLMGTYTPRLDDKGRLFLPAKFRDQLSEGLVVTRGQERCLTVWPRPAFEQVALQAQAAPVTDRAVRDYTRLLFAGASDDQPDKQGRLTIPPMLREYASLTRDVVVIGVVNRLEIWDAGRWQSYSDTHEESFSDLGQEVFPRD